MFGNFRPEISARTSTGLDFRHYIQFRLHSHYQRYHIRSFLWTMTLDSPIPLLRYSSGVLVTRIVLVRYESELGRKHLHLKSLQSKWPLETYDL